METELGLTGSIGLSHNKFLAKVASDLDKPRGFSVIGAAETEAFLRPKSGPPDLGRRPRRAGQRWTRPASAPSPTSPAGTARSCTAASARLGERLWHLARGEDHRRVTPHERLKIDLERDHLQRGHRRPRPPRRPSSGAWPRRSRARAKAKDLAGRTVTLKLKRADFALISRRHALRDATQIADRIYREARALFDAVGAQRPLPADRRRPRPTSPTPARGRPDRRPARPRGPQTRRGRARRRRDPRPVRRPRRSSRAAPCASGTSTQDRVGQEPHHRPFVQIAGRPAARAPAGSGGAPGGCRSSKLPSTSPGFSSSCASRCSISSRVCWFSCSASSARLGAFAARRPRSASAVSSPIRACASSAKVPLGKRFR